MFGFLKHASFLKSKKFWVTVAGIATAGLSKKLGLDATQTAEIVGSTMVYVVGQGIHDHGKETAKK